MDKGNIPSERISLLRRLWCWIVGHQFYVLQEFGPTSRRICCDHCGGDWGMNDAVRAIIPWDSELERMYRMFGHRIKER